MDKKSEHLEPKSQAQAKVAQESRRALMDGSRPTFSPYNGDFFSNLPMFPSPSFREYPVPYPRPYSFRAAFPHPWWSQTNPHPFMPYSPYQWRAGEEFLYRQWPNEPTPPPKTEKADQVPDPSKDNKPKKEELLKKRQAEPDKAKPPKKIRPSKDPKESEAFGFEKSLKQECLQSHFTHEDTDVLLEQDNLVEKTKTGFRILRTHITTKDVNFIRNYSRIIGYPLRTTQSNTVLGYFSSFCNHPSCTATMVVKKFELASPPELQHNH